jgi:hypothetical protein
MRGGQQRQQRKSSSRRRAAHGSAQQWRGVARSVSRGRRTMGRLWEARTRARCCGARDTGCKQALCRHMPRRRTPYGSVRRTARQSAAQRSVVGAHLGISHRAPQQIGEERSAGGWEPQGAAEEGPRRRSQSSAQAVGQDDDARITAARGVSSPHVVISVGRGFPIDRRARR